MSERIVLGEYYLPTWAITVLQEEDADFTIDRELMVVNWAESFSVCSGVDVVVVSDKPEFNESALFVGNKERSLKVILTGTPANISTIERKYALLGEEAFLDKVRHYQKMTTEAEDSQLGTGFASPDKWREIAASFPEGNPSFTAIKDWCQFNNPLYQVWLVLSLDN